MATISNSANVAVFLDNREFQAPRELFNLEATLEYGNEGVQPDINIEDITFTGSARTEFLNRISEGLSGGVGIFEGIPFRIEASNKDISLTVYDGFVSLEQDSFLDNLATNELKVKLVKTDGLNRLQDELDSLSFGNLVDEGIITDSDYETQGYVVKKPFNLVEQLTNSIVIYLLAKELAELIQRQGETTATSAGLASTTPPASPVATANYSIIKTAIDIAYGLTMVALLIRLSRQLVNSFLPPRREHKVLSARVAMDKIAQKLGYEFVAGDDLSDIDNIYFLPSNQRFDQSTIDGLIGTARGTAQGIPNPSDYGYSCSEFVQLLRNYFYANISVNGNELRLDWKDSQFFETQADLAIQDVLDKPYTYNTSDATRSRLIAFQTDITDIWTIENFKGTNYQVLTNPVTVNNEKMITLYGAEQVDLPVALGSRNDSLNALETAIAGILEVFDTVVNTLGGAFGVNVNFSQAVTGKIGLLKVSDNNHSVPKLLWRENGQIPANHREKLSAKVSYEKYHSAKSFVTNADRAQKKIFNNQRIPFGIFDFAKALNNAYIYNDEGKSVKVTSLSWQMLGDSANISYYERGRYTNNLEETFIEQD